MADQSFRQCAGCALSVFVRLWGEMMGTPYDPPEQRFPPQDLFKTIATVENFIIIPAQPRDIEVTEITVQATTQPGVVQAAQVVLSDRPFSGHWILGAGGAFSDPGFWLTAGTNVSLNVDGPAGSSFSVQIRYRTPSACDVRMEEDPATRRTIIHGQGTGMV